MKKLFLFLPVLGLSACMATQEMSTTEQQLDNELEVAASVIKGCDAKEHDADTCANAQDGTIPITHPVEDIAAPIEPKPEISEQPEEVQEYTNLWMRIRQQFNFEVPDDRRITAQQNWYLKHPEYMDQ